MDRSGWRLILASRSPRRRELLREAGYRFTVCPPDEEVESEVDQRLEPTELVRELARRKAACVVDRIGSGRLSLPGPASRVVVVGCDTVVECEGRILGKPAGRDDARRMLETLRGRRHCVVSGLCLWPIGENEVPLVDVATTTLRMDLLGDDQIEEYLAGDGWQGKAGAFGYQDRTGWVHVVEGSASNVVGLPMELLAAMLRRLGHASC